MPENSLRSFAAVAVILGLLACSSDGVTGPRPTPLTGSLAVGDLVTVNVNGNDDCTNAVLHVARVEAVGTRALILNDTLNPKNGFTSADFQRFAAKFDTLVYPLDVAAFGEPTDIDQNGHIGLIFTRAVNELTPANSDSYVGGFTFSRDLFPVKDTERALACAASNQGEFFYLLAPDPSGEINNNRRSTAFVDQVTTPVIAHEFQHLINASRRLYVNVNSTAFEVTWLDEGLAHIAEELLYYHESGYAPRSNLDATAVRATTASFNAFASDMAGNFGRYKTFLQNTSTNSPFNANDSLPTRGAAWSLLRYLADEKTAGFPATASASLRRTGSGTVAAPGAATGTTDYAAVVVNSATNQLALVNFNIRVDNAAADAIPASSESAAANRSVLFGAPAGTPTPDHTFESRLRARERRLMPEQADRARAWYRATRPGAMMRRASFDIVPGTSVDGDSWYRLANSIDTGIVNLQNAFGVDASVAVRNWSVTNQVDDVSGIIPAEYLQPSWNWHSLYTSNLLGNSTTYPLAVRPLLNALPASGSVMGGGSAYFRFTVPIAGNATVTFTDNSGAPASTLQLVLVRTR
jgi:hypothetical protein